MTRKNMAEEVLAACDEMKIWRSLLYNSEPKIRFDAIVYLTNRRDGLPSQSIGVAHFDASEMHSRPVLNVTFVSSDGQELNAGSDPRTIEGITITPAEGITITPAEGITITPAEGITITPPEGPVSAWLKVVPTDTREVSSSPLPAD